MVKIFIHTAWLLFITVSFALGQPGPEFAEIPPDPPAATVPISGIEWLLFAGGLFGARKAYKIYKNR